MEGGYAIFRSNAPQLGNPDPARNRTTEIGIQRNNLGGTFVGRRERTTGAWNAGSLPYESETSRAGDRERDLRATELCVGQRSAGGLVDWYEAYTDAAAGG
jgi:hypothetical protein